MYIKVLNKFQQKSFHHFHFPLPPERKNCLATLNAKSKTVTKKNTSKKKSTQKWDKRGLGGMKRGAILEFVVKSGGVGKGQEVKQLEIENKRHLLVQGSLDKISSSPRLTQLWRGETGGGIYIDKEKKGQAQKQT